MNENPGTPSTRLDLQRKAILVADIVESVRLLADYEASTIDCWRAMLEIIRESILPRFEGRLVKSLGDGILVEFDQVKCAVDAARELQALTSNLNTSKTDDSKIWLRIGIHVADVVVDDLDIYGSGVNLAARIAGLAGAGQIWVSTEARDELIDGLDCELQDQGLCWVKHFPRAIHAFSISNFNVHDAPRAPQIELPPGASISVQPFTCTSASPHGPALADMLSEQVSMSLSRSPYLRLISRWSSSNVAARLSDPSEIGVALGANYLVQGHAIDINGTVRIGIEIIHAPSGELLVKEQFRTSVQAILENSDESIIEIAQLISEFVVSREIETCVAAPMPTLQSHRLLTSAIALIHRSSTRDFERSYAFLEELANRHARHAQPHAWLAHWHAMSVVQGVASEPQAAAQRALHHAQRALVANNENSLALTMAGLVRGFLLHDLDGAEAMYTNAVHVNPNDSLAWLYIGTLRAWRGDGAGAWSAAERALSLAPHDPLRYYYDSLAGLSALAAGDVERAYVLSKNSIRLQARHTSTLRTLAIAEWKLGKIQESRATMKKILDIEPGFTVTNYLKRFPGGCTQFSMENAELLVAAGAPRH